MYVEGNGVKVEWDDSSGEGWFGDYNSEVEDE